MKPAPKVYVIVLIGGLAYLKSLAVPFLFDDALSIVENARLRRLWPPAEIAESLAGMCALLTLYWRTAKWFMVW